MIIDCIQSLVSNAIRSTIPVAAVEAYPDHVITLMTPGTWYEYTGPTLSTLTPDPAIDGGSPLTEAEWTTLRGSSQFPGIFAYSGAMYDTVNKYYLINGGGHTDYHGNEWYYFDILNMIWVRLNYPDVSASYSGAADGYSDDTSRPSAYHTYNGLEYSTVSGTYFRGGASPSGSSTSVNTGLPWTFDGVNYTELTATNFVGYLDTNVNGAPHCVCYDVTNNRFWQMTQYGLWSRNAASPATPTLRKNATSDLPGTANSHHITMRHDVANNLLVCFGSSISYIWDISTPNSPTVTHSHTWTGDAAPRTVNGVGMDYDHNNQDLVMWSGGADIFVVDAVNHVTTKMVPNVANTVTPTSAHANGTNGRFRYIGVWGGKSCFIAVNSVSGSVYFYKRVA